MPRRRLALLLALLVALAAGYTDSLEGDTAKGEKPPPLEVVIAKFKEDVGWVDDVPREWAVTIYDKVPLLPFCVSLEPLYLGILFWSSGLLWVDRASSTGAVAYAI